MSSGLQSRNLVDYSLKFSKPFRSGVYTLAMNCRRIWPAEVDKKERTG